MEKAYTFGVIAHGTDTHEIVGAIYSLEGDLSLEARASLNPLLNSRIYVAETLPKGANIARIILPELSVKLADGTAGRKRVILRGRAPELTLHDAYELLVEEELVPISDTFMISIGTPFLFFQSINGCISSIKEPYEIISIFP